MIGQLLTFHCNAVSDLSNLQQVSNVSVCLTKLNLAWRIGCRRRNFSGHNIQWITQYINNTYSIIG